MIYSSTRKFRIDGYTVSHGFLLLRSEMLYDGNEVPIKGFDFNIDIEFVAVAYLEMPTKLVGLEITQIDVAPTRIQRHFRNGWNKIFQIRSEGQDYYLVSAGFQVGTNCWMSENRIWNPDLNYDQILATS